MSLFDNVISALAPPAGSSAGGQGDLVSAVIGLLGQGGGGLGGLAGLVEKFHQGGLGDMVNSWIGSGQNLPVSADQLSGVLGHDTLGAFAQKLGLNSSDALGQLAHLLPQVVDKLTPQGQLPAAADSSAAGGMGDLGSLLGGLLGKA